MKEELYAGKYLTDNRKKPAISVTRYMVYLLIVTLTITGVSLSRYATSTTKSDSARVAVFDVDVTLNGRKFTNGSNSTLKGVDYNVSGQTFTFTVTNNSEVAVKAHLVIDLANSDVVPTISPRTGSTPNYESDWLIFAPNAGSQTITVTLTCWTGLSNNDARMYVEYEQID